MKRLSFLAFLLAFAAVGCGHSPSPVSSLSSPPAYFQLQLVRVDSDSEQVPLKSPAASAPAGSDSTRDKRSLDGLPEEVGEELAKAGNENAEPEENAKDDEGMGMEEEATIADPLEPFNRAMFQFNDKLYFWVLKPVAQGYNKIVPEPARISVKNFFTNLGFPVRFISCLFQADLKCAAAELGRFTVNTIWGVGGLLDPSSSEQLNLPKGDADIGQTLGVYGIGQGFYVVWPVLGPSSARDSVGLVGDFFLYPVSYISPWYDWLAVRGYQEVNDTSLRIGDYESLKGAAIDPYVALRDAYRQYRQKKVEASRGKPEPPKPGGVR